MNKLSKKFIVGIVIILAASFLCLILFNTQYVERFYLHEKKQAITKMCNEFTTLLHKGDSPHMAIQKIESAYKVIIVEIESDPDSDNNTVNDAIQSAFQEKGIGFQKYWFWEEDYNKVLEGKNRIRLYQQEKLNYSLLINYIQEDVSVYAITMIVPNVSDAFQIANKFLIAVTISTIIIAIIFIVFLVRRITRPLYLFEEFAKRMRNNEYHPIEVHTRDELECVADSLNSMGNKVIEFQQTLQEKNMQMEQLLDNVAHDLKTPISLIQLYANGLKDGMDDGTFLNTILEENEQMSNMVNRLLYLSKIEKSQNDITQINVSDIILHLIEKYYVFTKDNDVEIHSSIEKGLMQMGEEVLLQSLFLNLITNAVKYSSGKVIIIELFRQKDTIIFTIANETDNKVLDKENIWAPYYVGEESRNKKMSGTGLGLSIVKKICDIQKYSIQCLLEEGKIIFTVIMGV